MIGTLKISAAKFLEAQGYTLSRKSRLKPPSATMAAAMQRIVDRQHGIQTVIDIGAAEAGWTTSLMHYLPDCQYFLVEAQPVHESGLTQFCQDHTNADYVLAAAGEKRGELYFSAAAPLGGQASYTPYPEHNITVPVTTLDYEVQTRGLKAPFLLKFDTHGFEVPILKGAIEVLKQTEVIVMECYNFKIAPECLLFFEMCEYLRSFGFRCVDLVDVMHRVYDDTLWQMDLVFIKDNRPEFSYHHYT
jgi:FkbM family methyltransferase